jgi:hypothetical protein
VRAANSVSISATTIKVSASSDMTLKADGQMKIQGATVDIN